MRVELSRNRKTATLISEGLVSPLWVHTRWIRDAFWTKLSRLFRYFWRAESSAASVLSPSLHQHLAATAPAFIGRWRGRKWHHPTWSYTSVAVRFGAPHSDDEGCVYSYVLLFQGLSILFYLILFYSTDTFWPGNCKILYICVNVFNIIMSFWMQRHSLMSLCLHYIVSLYRTKLFHQTCICWSCLLDYLNVLLGDSLLKMVAVVAVIVPILIMWTGGPFSCCATSR